MRLASVLWALPFWGLPSGASAYDPYADDRAERRFAIEGPDGLALVLKGGFSFLFADIEGAGGLGRDSATDTVTLGTRSGHARLDEVVLAPRLETPEGFRVALELAFDPTGAEARAAWIEGHWAVGEGVGVRGEVGLQRPIAAADPRLRRAPLAERSWYGASEAHGVVEGRFAFENVVLDVATSLAMVRPLGGRRVNDATEKGAVVVLAAEEARPFSGNGVVGGGRLRVRWGDAEGHLTGEGFGFVGTHAAEGGIDELRNRIAGFANLPGHQDGDPRDQETTLWWGGGRLEGLWQGLELRGEWIEGQDSLLRRRSLLVQGGYVWTRDAVWLGSVELRGRGEWYRLLDGDRVRVADPSQALTWDWDVWTVELGGWVYRRLLRLTVEHSVLAEGRDGPEFDNNETLAQLELRF